MMRICFLCLPLYLAFLSAGFGQAAEPTPSQILPDKVSGKGQSLYICGHSFNWFIDKPLKFLAEEAGYTDHKTIGLTKLGDSRPIQHWNVPDEKNTAKEALKTGTVTILTLAPHREMPDPGIELFADFAFEHNPGIRVMEQISWPDFPLLPETNWETMPAFVEGYLKRAREQAEAINKKHGRQVVTLVPVVTAFLELRAKIESGQMPGITHFPELFKDPKGHPTKPLADLTTFCWYAAIYQKSPVGMTSLDIPNDPVSAEMNRVLQQLAWDAVSKEPMSGLASTRTASR